MLIFRSPLPTFLCLPNSTCLLAHRQPAGRLKTLRSSAKIAFCSLSRTRYTWFRSGPEFGSSVIRRYRLANVDVPSTFRLPNVSCRWTPACRTLPGHPVPARTLTRRLNTRTAAEDSYFTRKFRSERKPKLKSMSKSVSA